MPTELHLIARPDIEHQPEFKEVEQLAHALLTHLNEPDVLTAIAAAHVVGAKSAAIQAILLHKAKELGFQDERKGLFVQYASSGLRPDYYRKVGSTGILMEVERGKILANNMDLLDFWKCHVCNEARYLFLVLPQLRQTKSGKKEKVVPRIRNRLSTFFLPGNAVNVDGVFLFAY